MGVDIRGSSGTIGTTFTTTGTETIPAATQAGDDLYCQASVNENANNAVACTCTDDDTGGNTWTQLHRGTNGNSWLWHKKATANSASKTVTVANAEDSVCLAIIAYSGAAAGDPTTNLSFEANASGNETHAEITPDFADSMICLANFNYVNDLVVANQTCTTPGTLTERDEATSTGGADCQTSHASALQVGGPTATGACTWTQTNAASHSLVWAIKPAVASGTVTGTATASITEADVVAGGKTIIITLTGDTWIAAGAASFDLQRANILQGLDSAQAEALGWNLQVRDTEVVTAVVRTSDTVVTITLSASALYNITAQETITVTVPGTAVVLGNAINATPTFTIDTVGGGGGTFFMHDKLLMLGVS